ncbi:hypothetical protein DL95DRAFT_399263 [Leptodontidium sp. 2 PMI_412]|nr:hypothetical protein DL95DRAFT_399263 [Leptodontidium sp. 2 PMI_412]
MERQLAELQRKLAEAEERAAEEQRKSEHAEARAAEEQRRREAAEADAEQSQPKNLIEYLEACHSFSVALEVITDATLTTQGDTTRPSGRPFPQRIVPWDDFPTQQEEVWQKISINPDFHSQRVYPSAHQLDYVQKYLDPITSELGLRHFARETVENPVRTLIEEIHGNEQLREQLQLRGTMMFESHTNLGQQSETSIEEEIEHLSITEPNTSKAGGRRAKSKGKQADKKGKKNAGGAGRRRAGAADQFCIYELSDGQRAPVVLIEYKAPHKFPLAEIIAGFKGEIRPAEEIINKEGDDVEFLSKSLVAAVVTQLFSSMVGKGVQRGYVFTGEAIIFLFIPDDPTAVFYHLSIPHLDFQEYDENRLHRTSVAQISAFVLTALATEAPGQSWHDAAAGLDTWAVEYIDILKKIPETIRKAPPQSSYKPSRWKGFSRSPIRTRSRRLALTCNSPADIQVHDGSDEDDDNDIPSPTPDRNARRHVSQGKSASAQHRGARTGPNESNPSGQDEMEPTWTPRVGDRPYCSQKCLLGLAFGGTVDDQCPNLEYHQGKHLRLSTFLHLVRIQLAKDRGRDADCKPFYVKGSRGALFKVRLSSHGYTLVAKAMKQADRKHLLQEAKVYGHLRPIQGSCIPVCLGTVDLELPYYYDHGVYDSMLFLSWAGRSLYQCLNRENEARILDKATRTLQAVHALQVLHTDAEPRNMLWDEQCERLMLVDFERAEILARSPLSSITPNRKRNRQGEIKRTVKGDDFEREIRSARGCISRCIR